MKRNEDQEIDPDNPWEGDRLDRQKVGVYFTDLIKKVEQPFVISLNSSYGTGKTNFLKRWEEHLNKENKNTGLKIKAIYFDAWATDFSHDPLAAFISTIITILPKAKNETFVNKVDALTIFAAKKFASYATGGLSNALLETYTEAQKELKKEANISNYIQDFRDVEKVIKDFKTTLTNLVQENDNKLVILVDELDRCRPTYAIEVLECIKHLFNIPNIIFVIAVDDDQLVNAVSSVYGSKLNGEGYLRKFFNWQLNLPKPSSHQYTNYLISKFELLEFFENDYSNNNDAEHFANREGFIIYFSTFCDILHRSLRDQEQAFTTLDLILRSQKNNILPLEILGFVLAIHSFYTNDEFQKFMNGISSNGEENFNPASSTSILYNDVHCRKMLESSIGIKNYTYLRELLFASLEDLERKIIENTKKFRATNIISEREPFKKKITLANITKDFVSNNSCNKLSEYLASQFQNTTLLLEHE